MNRLVTAIGREQSEETSMNRWALASIMIIVVFYAVVATALGSAAYFVSRRLSRQHSDPAITSIVVNTPALISGPSIKMALPAGSTLISANVDSNGGDWWYQNADRSHLNVLIAASRVTLRQPAVTDEYFRRVISVVEQSAGNRVRSMSAISDTRAGNYSGKQASYELESPSGGTKHAVALFVRRESDDLVVIVYGDNTVKNQIDRAASEMFRSLDPHPTPAQYDIHSADAVEPLPWRNQ